MIVADRDREAAVVGADDVHVKAVAATKHKFKIFYYLLESKIQRNRTQTKAIKDFFKVYLIPQRFSVLRNLLS